MRIKTKDDEERLEKSINKYPMEFKHNEAHLEGSKKGCTQTEWEEERNKATDNNILIQDCSK